ncbi:HD-GYP domain-containing protein [Caldibacillus lycopersici]|uniref:HD-GYP domain-containing protein n=1 Tax=Perspicuibacillus lycopersici TaxID=1325689 RepID=A0AAE3IUB8_9BACI|nr:HD-GYP domain-containing protein [Perspicuibacillus lycopersici]MCU9614780.1 HD-GYP domain-containing protein [Perspicuibacillus lycopersici]
MKKTLQDSLLYEEKQATIWFLWLFNTLFFVYDIFYSYFFPRLPWGMDIAVSDISVLNYVLYIAIIALLPISIYLIKTNRPENIKYIYFLTYMILNILDDIWIYVLNDVPYSSGNIIEIVLVLFSPIFTNKRFFYLVSFGTMGKYILIGLLTKDPVVIFPLLIVIVLSIIASILLHRFLSYVEAVKMSFDHQIESIVKGIIGTLELKDPYTRGHSERVAEYAYLLAEATGNFKKNELKSFYYACLLHDIGKVNIPDSILTKPGKLTDEEFALIKTHPVVGAKAVKDVDGIAENIDVIYHHHERWDGKGYPDGLIGEETPLVSRITAIADAFDAMTSSRSYRAAMSLDEAYKRILDGKGTQFDPKLVDIFKVVYPSWVEVHNNYTSKLFHETSH